MKNKGFTLIELMTVIIFIIIFGGFLSAAITGNTTLPNKQQCIAAGGKWSEGIQYGRTTQLCTYN